METEERDVDNQHRRRNTENSVLDGQRDMHFCDHDRSGEAFVLKVLKGTDSATVPFAHRPGDAGLDLYTSVDWEIPGGDVVNVPTGIAVEMPDNVWGMMVGRSSTIHRYGLQVNTGILDTGYRGELFIVCINLNRVRVSIKAGERLAQLILLPNITAQTRVVEVGSLGESERGDRGFGSTGR